MSQLILIRHGQSVANRDLMVAGQLDTPLTDLGRQQARQTAPLIQGIQVDSIHSSTLSRARETLSELNSVLNLEAPVTYHDDLRELHWGELQGTYDNGHGESALPSRSEWFTWSGRVPGGESYEEASNRIVGYFERVLGPELHSGKNVLLVAHAGVFKPLIRHLENLPFEETNNLRLANCEVRLYSFDDALNVVSVEGRRIP